jgi:BASS family bile acid:Na+ symporter
VIQALRWLGQQARWALPAGVFVGVLWPDLASLCRPLLAPAVVGTLVAALLRMDWSRMWAWAQRPLAPGLLTLWLTLLSPALVWWVADLLAIAPEWTVLLVLQAAGPPIGSAAAFAMFLGLEASLCMVSTVWATLALPLTLTGVVAWLLPQYGIEVDLGLFFARVLMLVALPFAVSALLRRWIGVRRLQARDAELAGLNVVMLVIFAVAVMEGVQDLLWSDTRLAVSLLAMACASVAVGHAAGYALCRWRGLNTAYTGALLSGNRNMGLLLVVTAGTAGSWFSLYVAIVQIPMYFAPLLLGPWLARSKRLDPASKEENP